MRVMRESDPIFRSKLRKRFHRLVDIGHGDIFALPDGGFGQYVNISAGKQKPGITVNYYATGIHSADTKQIPSKIELMGRKYPVNFSQVKYSF